MQYNLRSRGVIETRASWPNVGNLARTFTGIQDTRRRVIISTQKRIMRIIYIYIFIHILNNT